jgi:hypothetical protein
MLFIVLLWDGRPAYLLNCIGWAVLGVFYLPNCIDCFFATLAKFPQKRYIIKRGNEMAAKVKPVQPTEIKDIKIIREVIAEIRKPIPDKIIRRNEKMAAFVKELKK